MTIYFGSENTNFINGSSGADIIYGFGGNDHLFGNGGNDIIYGGAGNDFISGGAGSDLIVGGAGKDFLYGGGHSDADTFQYLTVGDSGLTTATADYIGDFYGYGDHLQVTAAVNNGTWRYFTNTSNNSIEDAVRATINLDNMNGITHHTAVAYQSAAMNETYLVMDIDNNGYYDTGIIFAGHIGGNPDWWFV